MSLKFRVFRASVIADQEGGGSIRLNHTLSISRRHALLLPGLSDLICFSCPSSMSNCIPMSSQALATLEWSSFWRSFSLGFAESADVAWCGGGDSTGAVRTLQALASYYQTGAVDLLARSAVFGGIYDSVNLLRGGLAPWRTTWWTSLSMGWPTGWASISQWGILSPGWKLSTSFFVTCYDENHYALIYSCIYSRYDNDIICYLIGGYILLTPNLTIGSIKGKIVHLWFTLDSFIGRSSRISSFSNSMGWSGPACAPTSL